MRNSKPVLLGEIATVRFGRADRGPSRIWIADRAGERSSVSAAVVLSVKSLADVDPGAVCRAVERAANEIQTILPEQVRVECRAFGPRDVRLRVRPSQEDENEGLAAVVEKAVAEILKLRGVASIWRVDAPTES
ncbi:MAG TPA: hypothetical protein VMV10_03085 [Pirellulales bacterium]|nr:hypothetical protein [Pirellulales bacterium]